MTKQARALQHVLRPVDVLVIGASAGGVEAFVQLFTGLRADFTLPIVALLHLPADRESRLAEIFGQRLALPVREARDKEPIVASTIYFAPPGYHLSIEKDFSFSLSGEAPVLHARPSIDVLMASAADVYGARVAGILLTGASADGAAGLTQITRHGGLSIVQDPAQAQMPVMPAAAIAMHEPDLVLSLREIHHCMKLLGAPR
jgi:two-component system chemotaxis response regulator CheB